MPAWKRNLVVIWFSNFTTLVGVACVVPFLPSIVRSTGVSDPARLRLLSGAVYAAAFLSAALMGPVWGLLGDRHGRKLMVLRSLLAIAVFMTLQSQVNSAWAFIVLRLLHGAFSGFVAPALTLVSASAPEDRQGFVASMLQTSLVSGGFAGPLLGGLVADRWGFHASFLVAGGMALLAFVLVWLFAIETDRPAAEPFPSSPPLSASGVSRFAADIRALLENPGLRRLTLLVFFFQFGLATTEPLMALFIHQLDPGAKNLITGSVFAAAALANLILAPLWGRRSDKTGYAPTLTLTLAGAALFYFPQAFVTAPWQLLPLRFALGCCLAGILPSAYALVGRMTPRSKRGGSFGLTLSAFQFGNVLGPLFGGAVAAAFGLNSVFFLTSAILVCAAWAVRRAVPDMPASHRS